jgi:serine/threonine protein kinase
MPFRDPAQEVPMPDPNDPALTVQRPPSPNSSAPGRPDETSGAANRGDSSGVAFGPSAEAGEVGTLGPYRVLKELGKGGMGAVYLAIDTRLDRKLALKVMLPEFAANREAKERFLREARAAAKITHDNVVTVYEADERDGVPYITMQFLQGYPLDEFLTKKGTPSVRHVIRIARETALGLAAAHKHGLVHRDIKPANLWLEAPNGRVKVLDFGLAKPIGTDTELTRTGAIVGTPAFMSPEQGRGLKVDHRTDLFSLGAVLYRLCTGRTPFEGPNVLAVLMALGTDDPKPVRELNPNTPEPLARLIHQLLAKKPEDRPQSGAEVAKQLLVILDQVVGAPVQALVPNSVVSGPEPGESSPVHTTNTDPWVTRVVSGDPQQAELSSSQPVVVDPVPVQPPLVSRMEVSAQPASAVSKPKARASEEEDEVTEAELTDKRKPKRKSNREQEPKKSSGKGLLIAGLIAALLVSGIVAGVLIGVVRQKPTDTVQQKPDEKTDPVAKPPSDPPKSPPDTTPVTGPKDKEPQPVVPKPPESMGGAAPQLKTRWETSIAGKLGLWHLYTSDASDLVLASAYSGDVAALDLKTGAVRPGFDALGKVGTPAFFPLEGRQVAVSSKGEEFRVWDEKTGREGIKLSIPNAPQPEAKSHARIYIAPNAKFAVAARCGPLREQHPVRVIDLEKKLVITELTWANGEVHFTADSSRVLVADSNGRCSWVKLPSGKIDQRWVLPPPTSGRYHGVSSISDDGSVLGYHGPAGRGPFESGPAILDGATGQVLYLFSNDYFYLSAVSVSADGRRAAVQRAVLEGFASYDILEWRTDTPLGRTSIKMDRERGNLPPFALTRDGTTLVVISNFEKKVYAFELDKGISGNPKWPGPVPRQIISSAANGCRIGRVGRPSVLPRTWV